MIAPVDVMGCYSIHDTVQDKRLYVLVSLILSSQTKDEINYQTMINLMINLNEEEINLYRVKYKLNKFADDSLDILISSNNTVNTYSYHKKDGRIYSNRELVITNNKLTLDNLINEKNLKDLIRPVGFHNKKYQTIKDMVEYVRRYGYPKDMQECIGIKGLGRKMSLLYLNRFIEEDKDNHLSNENMNDNHSYIKKVKASNYNNIYKSAVGISVDTHVHRICNLLGMVKTKTPDQTSKALEEIIEKKEWGEFNNVLVGYGQVLCMKKTPRCNDCVVKDKCTKFNIK
jgi:endonuclease III